MVSNGLFEENNEHQIFFKYFKSILQLNTS